MSRWLNGRIVALTVVFMISIFASVFYTNIDQSAAFFLTPFRMFEFAIGGLLTLIGKECKKWICDSLYLIGMVLIICSLVLFDEGTPFPGAVALVPCMGAALIIYAGGGSRFSIMLENHIMVHIGRVSYSLYLVHWPIIVLLTSYLLRQLRPVEIPLVLLAIYIIAYISFCCIETPFRERKQAGFNISDVILLRSMFGGMLFVAVLAWFAPSLSKILHSVQSLNIIEVERIQQGKKDRFSHVQRICAERGWDTCREKGEGVNVLILGDSHAPDALNALVAAYPDAHYVMISEGGCPPMTVMDFDVLVRPKHPSYDACVELHEKYLQTIWVRDFDYVFISVLFEWYRPVHLSHFLDELHSKTKAKVFVFSNYLVLERSFPEVLLRSNELKEEHIRHFDLYGDILSGLANEKNFAFVDKTDIFCDGRSWETCQLFSNGEPFSYDKHHLSLEFASLLGSILKSKADSFEELYQVLTLQK